MKSYIYLILTLLSISLFHTQATDKSWPEELAKQKDSVVAGAIGGSVGGFIFGILLSRMRSDPGVVLAPLTGGIVGSTLSDYLRPHDRDIAENIAFWTSFTGMTFVGFHLIEIVKRYG